MAIPTNIPIKKVTYNGVQIPLDGGGGGSWPPSPVVAGDTPVLAADKLSAGASSTSGLTSVGISITIKVPGTYRFKWMAVVEESVNCLTRLYQNDTAVGTQRSVRDGQGEYEEDIECEAGDEIDLRIQGGRYSGYTYGACGGLIACIDGDNGF